MIHTCTKKHIRYFLHDLGEVFPRVQFAYLMSLYNPQYNHSSVYCQSDQLWSLIHLFHTLEIYNTRVEMLQCPLLIVNLYPKIVKRVPFLQKQSQYFLIILMVLSLNWEDAVSPILSPFSKSSQSSAWLYVIISFRIRAFQSTFGLNTALPSWL